MTTAKLPHPTGNIVSTILRGRRSLLALPLFFYAGLATAQTLTTLYNLQGGSNDGNWPCGIIRDSAGNLYGEAQFGGPENAGAIFELNTNNEETVLHLFESPDGQSPCSKLLRSASGDLYGTTIYGGAGENGTVFRIHNDTLLQYKFQGGLDGQNPSAGLTENVDGALYGTTAGGGSGNSCLGGCGTVFRFDPSGHKTIVYNFHGADGANPGAALIHDAQGNLYGTTSTGGSNQMCPQEGGCGTVFKLDPRGILTVLYSFLGGTDGWDVQNGVVRDSEGNLYGTTLGGGTSSFGTIFEITHAGAEKILYSFAGAPDGADPSQIVLDNSTLYGTTYTGGNFNCDGLYGGCGTIFRFDKTGHEKVLYRFSGSVDGAQPFGSIALDSAGNIYGTTQSGVKNGCPPFPAGCGTVWKFAPARQH